MAWRPEPWPGQQVCQQVTACVTVYPRLIRTLGKLHQTYPADFFLT